MFIVMLNLFPQLKMPQAKTISTISSSLKCSLSDAKNSSVTAVSYTHLTLPTKA